MAMNAKAGSFNITTGAATSTVQVTGVGFQPKAIIFFWSGRTESTDASGRATTFRGVGAAASTSARIAATNQSQDAQAAAVCDQAYHNGACIELLTTAGGIDGLGDLSSFDSDGFTIVIDDAFSSDIRVSYLALGGDSLTNATTGRVTEATATGNFSVTGVGFQPDLLLFMGPGRLSANPAAQGADSLFMLGAAISSSSRFSYCGGSNDGATTMQTVSYLLDIECASATNASASTNLRARADFVSMDSDGFTLNQLETAGGSFQYLFLALKGGNYRIENLLTQTNTTTDITETGFGFTPSGVLFVSACRSENTQDTATDHDQWTVGACNSATSRTSQATMDADNTADSQCSTAIEHDEVYINLDTSGSVQGLMDIKSMDSDGFTCIMDDADPSQSFVAYIAFGPAPSGGGPSLKTRKTLLGVGI